MQWRYSATIATLSLIQSSVSLSIPSLPSLLLQTSNISVPTNSPNSTIKSINLDDWPLTPFIFTYEHDITIAILQYGATVSPLREYNTLSGLQQIERHVRGLDSPDAQFWPQLLVHNFVSLLFTRLIRPQPQPYITIGEAGDVVSALYYLTRMYGPRNIARANIFSGQRLDMRLSLQVA